MHAFVPGRLAGPRAKSAALALLTLAGAASFGSGMLRNMAPAGALFDTAPGASPDVAVVQIPEAQPAAEYALVEPLPAPAPRPARRKAPRPPPATPEVTAMSEAEPAPQALATPETALDASAVEAAGEADLGQ